MTQPPQQPDPSNPRGWHPDPAGVPGRFRFWDGQQWREDVTFDQNAPLPDGNGGPGGSAAPGRSRGGLIALIVGGAAVVVALVLVLVFVLPGVLSPTDPEESATPSSPPTGPPSSPGASGPAELNCAGGNKVAVNDATTQYSSTGVTITMPGDWGFRLSKDQWGWLDDQAAFGKVLEPKEDKILAGAVLGGVAARNGFTGPEKATADIITCLNRYGVYNDKEYEQTEVSSEEVTLGGMSGWKRVYEFTDQPDNPNYPKSQITVYVVDSGQPAKMASLLTLAPVGHSEAEAAVEKIAQSMKKQ